MLLKLHVQSAYAQYACEKHSMVMQLGKNDAADFRAFGQHSNH